jgi:hypothetical protein
MNARTVHRIGLIGTVLLIVCGLGTAAINGVAGISGWLIGFGTAMMLENVIEGRARG